MSTLDEAKQGCSEATDGGRRLSALVVDDSGLAVLRDASLAAPVPGGREAALLELKRLARAGRLFFVDGEEAIRFTAELLVDRPLPTAEAALYEQVGGTFLLELPSGELQLSGFSAWERGEAGLAVSVAPGAYALLVHSRQHLDPAALRTYERGVVGAADMAYRDRVTWLGVIGCLPTVAALGALVLPPLRRLALGALAVAALAWAPYALVTRLPRYRRVARTVRELEAALPLFYLQLQPLASSDGLSGGCVRLD